MTWPRGLLDASAVGRRAFWIVVPISAIGVLTVLPPDLSPVQAAGLWLLASIVSTGALGLGLSLGAPVVRRMQANAIALRFAVACTVVLAGALRGVGIDVTFAVTGQQDAYSPTNRIVVSAVIFSLWLVLIGGLISAWTRYQRQRQELLDEYVTRQLQLRLLDPERPGALGEETVRELDSVTAAVQGVLAHADGEPDQDYVRLSASLKAVIEDRMRPLVHQLWFADAPEVSAEPSTRAFLLRAFVTPVPLGWALGVYGLAVLFAGIVSVGLELGLVAAAIEFSALACIVLVERWRWPVPRVLPRAIMLALAGLAPVFLAWLVVHPLLVSQVSWAAAISLTITGPGVVFGSCAARAALDDGGPSVRELRELLDERVWDDQLRALETRNNESELASVLHNTMQARLYAAAIQMETAALEGDDAKAQLALDYARQALDAPVRTPTALTGSVAERLDTISAAWMGIVDVRVTCPSQLPMSAAAKLVVDAAEECVANAIRHAHASVISVDVSVDGDDLVLTVVDDGAAPDSMSVPGLGTAWMEKVSRGRFDRRRMENAGNRVVMRIAI